ESACERRATRGVESVGEARRSCDQRDLGLAFLSRIRAVETNPHPDPFPFRKGEGNLRWHPVRLTAQGSEKGAFYLSSPRSERGDQGEGRFQLHTYGLGSSATLRSGSREIQSHDLEGHQVQF